MLDPADIAVGRRHWKLGDDSSGGNPANVVRVRGEPQGRRVDPGAALTAFEQFVALGYVEPPAARIAAAGLHGSDIMGLVASGFCFGNAFMILLTWFLTRREGGGVWSFGRFDIGSTETRARP
jgi:hypothetical protein